jgi:hypothetical protein
MAGFPSVEVAVFDWRVETLETPWEGMVFPEDETGTIDEHYVKILSLYNYGGIFLVSAQKTKLITVKGMEHSVSKGFCSFVT